MLYVYTCLIYVSIDRGIGVNKWVIDRGIDRSISWQVFLFICSKNSHPHAIIAIIIDANKANNLTHYIMFHQNLYHVHFQKVGDFRSQLRSWRFCLKIKSLSGGLWLAGGISTMVIPCNSTCLLVKSVKSMWNPLKYVFLDTNNTLRIVKSYWISNVQDIHFKLYNSGRYFIVCFFLYGTFFSLLGPHLAPQEWHPAVVEALAPEGRLKLIFIEWPSFFGGGTWEYGLKPVEIYSNDMTSKLQYNTLEIT